MVFSSVEECIAYIESAIADCMPLLSKEIKIIMDDVTRQQVRGWSNQIFSSVMPKSDSMSAEASFEDNGHWYSLITGESVGNPIKFLESGATWGRGASNIMSTATSRAESEIPRKFLMFMRAKGIPIQ